MREIKLKYLLENMKHVSLEQGNISQDIKSADHDQFNIEYKMLYRVQTARLGGRDLPPN